MDKHNLKRFKDSQSNVIDQVFQELIDGRKESHWMWYVFPQNDVHSSTPLNYIQLKVLAKLKHI